VGSPRGLEGSFSFGHITALGRDDLALPKLRFQNLIQTDAAINLGNSGGPLCNIDGEVIGINVAIVYGAESLGFAIPIDTAKKVVKALIEDGKVTRGYLGVVINSAEPFAEAEGLPDKNGAYVQDVQAGTVAERAGLQVYDIIRKVNGDVVKDDRDLVTKISDLPPGEKATLEVWRDGKTINIDVTLGEFPADVDERGIPKEKPLLGLGVMPLSEDMFEELGLEEGTEGVIVSEVDPGSAPDEAGIRPGDVIIEIAKQPVTSVEDFRALMKRHAKPGESLLVRVARPGGMPTVMVIKVPEDAIIE
jgi:serine protease Do